MDQIIFSLFILFIIVLSFGVLAQKYLKLPWMFTVVITGLLFSHFNILPGLSSNEAFKVLSQIGSYCLLFLIGLKMDLKEIKKMFKDIFLGNIISCLFEGIGLSLFFYFAMGDSFHNSYLICLLAGIGFATIGEVILIAILNEFDLTNTKFGQFTIGMGVSDDIVEVIVLTFVTTLPAFYYFEDLNVAPSALNPIMEWGLLLLSFVILFIILFVAHKWGQKVHKILVKIGKSSLKFFNGFLFLAIFLGMLLVSGLFVEELMVIGAIIAGIMCKSIFPVKLFEQMEKNFQFLMMFISPFFFYSIGYKINLTSISGNEIGLISIIILISIGTRVLGSVIFFKDKLGGVKPSIVFGFGLGAKFSTSVIILSLLMDYGYITVGAYSLLMISFLVIKVIVVFIYSIGINTIILPKYSDKQEKETTKHLEITKQLSA